MNKISALRLELFKHSQESFLSALDSAKIDHCPVQLFSTKPHNSGVIETISSLSEAVVIDTKPIDRT